MLLRQRVASGYYDHEIEEQWLRDNSRTSIVVQEILTRMVNFVRPLNSLERNHCVARRTAASFCNVTLPVGWEEHFFSIEQFSCTPVHTPSHLFLYALKSKQHFHRVLRNSILLFNDGRKQITFELNTSLTKRRIQMEIRWSKPDYCPGTSWTHRRWIWNSQLVHRVRLQMDWTIPARESICALNYLSGDGKLLSEVTARAFLFHFLEIFFGWREAHL